MHSYSYAVGQTLSPCVYSKINPSKFQVVQRVCFPWSCTLQRVSGTNEPPTVDVSLAPSSPKRRVSSRVEPPRTARYIT
jgi:hypothetical protein